MVRFFIQLSAGLILGLFLLATNSFADGKTYFGTPKKVWNMESQDESEEEQMSESNTQMNAVRAKIQSLQDKMFLSPTKDNVRNFIEMQNAVTGRAHEVESTWKSVLLDNPEIDYTLIHPTNNTAIQVEYDQETENQNKVIHELAQKSGLFFFYRSSCPYCRRFAPIVKKFADTYGITVLPITTDGIALPEFPDSYQDKGQAEQFHVTVEPALFSVNPYTHQAVPISYGLTSEADLKKRILDVATHFGRNKK